MNELHMDTEETEVNLEQDLEEKHVREREFSRQGLHKINKKLKDIKGGLWPGMGGIAA